MIDKGFLASRLKKNSASNERSSVITNTILLIGVAILIFALLFMIINLSKADSIIMVWIPFMIAGVVLVFVSLVMNYFHKNRNRGRQKRQFRHETFKI